MNYEPPTMKNQLILKEIWGFWGKGRYQEKIH